jgi:hypothetical protein
VANRTKRTQETIKRFLESLDIAKGNVSNACQSARIARVTAYEWRKDDEQFRADWDGVVDRHMDALENEIYRRAYDGCNKPVFYQGEQCGEVTEYSDTLAMFILKGHRPEKYRENVRQEIGGPNGGPIRTEASIIVIPDNGRNKD